MKAENNYIFVKLSSATLSLQRALLYSSMRGLYLIIELLLSPGRQIPVAMSARRITCWCMQCYDVAYSNGNATQRLLVSVALATTARQCRRHRVFCGRERRHVRRLDGRRFSRWQVGWWYVCPTGRSDGRHCNQRRHSSVVSSRVVTHSCCLVDQRVATYGNWNFRTRELSFPGTKVSYRWNFRSLTLIIKPILYTTFDALFNYSYAVGVDGSLPLSSVTRPTDRLSVRNGCIVDNLEL